LKRSMEPRMGWREKLENKWQRYGKWKEDEKGDGNGTHLDHFTLMLTDDYTAP
jgi:hypothetical protein